MVAAKNNINLTGRSAVVTGGAQGIGYAVAQRLLQSGAAVSLWDMDAALLKSASAALGKEGAVSSVQVDVANPESVVDAVKASQAAMGTIEIMVACAGIAGPTVPSWEYPIADWQRVIDIDLNGVYYCCREVLPLMRAQNYGRIVNVASIAGKEGNPNAAPYSAAKARVDQIAGQGNRRIGHRRQLHHAGGGEDTHLRPDFPKTHRLHAVEDPTRAFLAG